MTTQETAAPAAEETPARPVCGEIIARTHAHGSAMLWTLGTRSVVTGLTAQGIAAAARATAEFLDGLTGAERQALDHRGGATRVRIDATDWEMPLLPHLTKDVAALMVSVVNAEGSLGRIG